MENHFQFECHPGQLVERAGFLISFQRLVGLIRPLTVSFFRPVFRYFVPCFSFHGLLPLYVLVLLS